MTEHRIRQLRFIFWLTVAWVALLVWPHEATYQFTFLGLVPIALFMPVLATLQCTVCTGGTHTHENVQIDLTGIAAGEPANGCGSCAGYNRSFVLIHDTTPLHYTCEWSKQETFGTPGTDVCSDGLATIWFGRNNPTNKLQMAYAALGFINITWDMTGGGAGQDCGDVETGTGTYLDVGGDLLCDFSGATPTATPL